MKSLHYLIIPALLLIVSSCSGPEEAGIPETLKAKQELLKTKRAELRDLNKELKDLEGAIAAQDPDYAPKTTLVTARTLVRSNFTDYATLQATVQADETATAGAELPGLITSLRVDEGDNIQRGQLIATINVESVSVQRTELETSLSLAKTVFERQKRLWDQNIGSELQYLEAKNNYERIQQGLKSFDVQLAKKNVYAPISGTIQQVFMRAGENAMPGAPIVSIISTGDLKIIADAPEEFLTKIKNKQSVKVTVPALGESFEASVSRIGKTVDASNRTFAVEVNVPRAQAAKLKTNLLAQVEILNSQIEDAIVISQDVVQREVNGRKFVFIAAPGEETGTMIAKKASVETGATFANKVVITSGLKVGDQVIQTGSRGLVEGQAISLTTDPASIDRNGK
jgi:RND family efflux transporter MFP subunit